MNQLYIYISKYNYFLRSANNLNKYSLFSSVKLYLSTIASKIESIDSFFKLKLLKLGNKDKMYADITSSFHLLFSSSLFVLFCI